ncbi:MAG: hypothetical protein HC932_01190 [Thermales bacterium]|nr:hypothetical protein [Thermales bacterium]
MGGLQEVGIKKDSKKEANLNTPNGIENGYLRLLKDTLFSPGLSLLTEYLLSKNGNKKTTQNCIADFASSHKVWFRVIFIFDVLCRSLYISIVLFIALRGLGIIDFLIN